MIQGFLKWVFKKELDDINAELAKAHAELNRAKYICEKLDQQRKVFNDVLSNIDVSVDVHEYHKYARSWAVISLQGRRCDYIKFVDLGNSDIEEIARFLRMYERHANIKVDASPHASSFLKVDKRF